MSRKSGRAIFARPREIPVRRPLWELVLVLAVLPVIVNGFFLLMMSTEAENSWEIYGVSILAAGGMGLIGGYRGFNAAVACLGAAWLPALMTWKRTYWALGMPSPGGTAQSLLRWATALEAPAWAAVAGELALVAFVGWALMRFDRFWKMRTGRSMFDE